MLSSREPLCSQERRHALKNGAMINEAGFAPMDGLCCYLVFPTG
jgi:hypothetical protein